MMPGGFYLEVIVCVEEHRVRKSLQIIVTMSPKHRPYAKIGGGAKKHSSTMRNQAVSLICARKDITNEE